MDVNEPQCVAPTKENNPDVAVTQILRQAGIPAHIKGYRYLRDAISMVLYEGSLLQGVCAHLYPLVAWKHQTTPDRVERDIRYAIGMAWKRDNGEAAAMVFEDTLTGVIGRPTNFQFIGMVASKVRAESG